MYFLYQKLTAHGAKLEIPSMEKPLGIILDLTWHCPMTDHPTLAFGSGSNTIFYSEIGKSFVGLGCFIFSEKGNGGFWNGDYWVVVGKGTNTIATSIDGIEWKGSQTIRLYL